MPQKPEPNTVQKPVTAVVTRQYFAGKEPSSKPETKNEELTVRLFATEPAKVSVSNGLTLNLGNFESARLDVSVSVPCYREEIDDAYVFALNWVNNRISAEVSEVRKNKPNIF